MRRYSRQLVHSHPWAPSSQVAWGLALFQHLQLQSCSGAPSAGPAILKQVFRMLHAGLAECPERAAGWLALGEIELARNGLTRLTEQHRDGNSSGIWVCTGYPVVNVRQVAMRGLAHAAQADGDLPGAMCIYERLLGTARLGHIQAAHWMHGDYGWLHLQQGNLKVAKHHLEQALALASNPSAATLSPLRRPFRSLSRSAPHTPTFETPPAFLTEVADYRFRLGRICWELGGALRTDKQHAHAHWLAAAAAEGALSRAAAFAWLGKYYREVAGDTGKARRCYQRALAIDPVDDVAGRGLCGLLNAAGSQETALKLCQEIATRAPKALWAWQGLGRLLLDQGRPEAALVPLQSALRLDPRAAATWEALGAAYHKLGRLTAALKAYGRSIELEPMRIYALVQSGTILRELGSYPDSEARFQQALHLEKDHPAAQLGAAETMLSSARRHLALGASGLAAAELRRAAKHASACAAANGQLEAAWKLLGDIGLAFHAITPLPTTDSPHADTAKDPAAAAFVGWEARIRAVQGAGRTYCKALHLAPWRGSALCVSYEVG
ncbi:hypothetical protein WJX84_002642 [Apatococcus fuscideae]|uniref:Tetratricopeptide repeat protein n=1 Tax=Apatococcus fuscideae TaxID=2026836 RepID=A0AAW1SKK8_9CHLO